MSRLNRRFWQSSRRMPRRFMAWLLRALFLANRPGRLVNAGFVLPTTVLMLLVLSLTVGALSFRSFSRSTSAIAQREQQVVSNATAPAIERAKSKIEYLFQKDISRNSVPPSEKLQTTLKGLAPDEPPYTLPDETRLDVNNDGTLDNAWAFESDIDGDGTIGANELIVYSILMDDKADPPGGGTEQNLESQITQDKANSLVARNGPIDVQGRKDCPVELGTSEEGWQELGTDTSTLKKTFQITAFAANSNDVNRTASTFELQQIREANKGNKWGAWFRNDLELFPGEDFTWNGAIHTEGSVFLAFGTAGGTVNLRMISSNNSCLYSRSASEITVGGENTENNFRGGQVVVGLMGRSSGYGSDSGGMEIDWATNDTGVPGTDALAADGGNDSVNPGSSTIDDVSLNPIEVFTSDTSIHRDPADWTEDGGWEGTNFVNRIEKEVGDVDPFLDDTYRADNRYGPKSVYDDQNSLVGDGGKKLGDPITSNNDLTSDEDGLDGYWERRSIFSGLRLIVGQRLELGNPYGWVGAYASNVNPDPASSATSEGYRQINMDPLYPSFSEAPYTLNNSAVAGQQLQRMSLRDNLAAVQSMAVYHYKEDGNTADDVGAYYPLACMSLVAHPGTDTTLLNSRTFNRVSYTTAATGAVSSNLDIDFFNGRGTNTWEYGPPLATEAAFESAYNAGTPSALKIALENLANFAGDPEGGAPSFTPVQEQSTSTLVGDTHPYPTMAMWGDYSTLRRVIDSGTAYGAMSPADKTTLHTAACTLGMLADNVKRAQINYGNAANQTPLASLATAVGSISGLSDTVADKQADAYLAKLTGETQRLARIVFLKEQIARDRQYGFERNPATIYTIQFGPYNASADEVVPGQVFGNGNINLGFDYTAATGNNFFGFGAPTDATSELQFLRLAAVAGGLDNEALRTPRFPSLYYLFPTITTGHDYDGDATDGDAQPTDELYIDYNLDGDNNGATNNYIRTANGGASLYTYAYIADADLFDTAKLALAPKTTGFELPTPTPASTGDDDNWIDDNGSQKAVLFQDKGFMDGREMLGVRALQVDINLATTNTAGPAGDTDKWIPDGSATVDGGIVYAFREDARREDEIVRPIDNSLGSAQDAWTTCSAQFNQATPSAVCMMDFDYGATQDPPLRRVSDASDNYISPKPVDYYADYERRPHGFRLVNGITLNRDPAVEAGMSFITDNSVYIKGDFNLHTSNGTVNNLEEFTTLVDGNNNGTITKAEFYTDRAVAAINTANFAKETGDAWRPVEIVADAITILSSNFSDGVASDTFLLAEPGSEGGGTSSYQNNLRVEKPGVYNNNGSDQFYIRPDRKAIPYENPYADNYDDANSQSLANPESPIKIFRNGIIVGADNQGIVPVNTANIDNFRKKERITAAETYVNALLISGIVPSRLGQSYGGLHNFPRLLEHWSPGGNAVDLNISGGFFQLNYSTASTAAWDQDTTSWEPGGAAVAGAFNISFYGAPKRIWGYDVALQYAPPGPISERFVTIDQPRSEYYRELPVTDEYVRNLQCAEDQNGTKVIADPIGVTCPA